MSGDMTPVAWKAVGGDGVADVDLDRSVAEQWKADGFEVTPLFAAPPVSDHREENGWQPIETAPKDGTRLLACGPNILVDFFHWQGHGPYVGWRDSFITVYTEEDAGPTFWQPIPRRPPALNKEGK